jgi:hypothetical protein
MSDTKIDFAKVTQMLDAGWQVVIFKNGIGSYTAKAKSTTVFAGQNAVRFITDDFTPEQALTRLAYKIHGEIL